MTRISFLGNYRSSGACVKHSDAIADSSLASIAGDHSENQEAENDLLAGGVDVVADEDRREDGENQRADDGVGVVAAGACDRGTAQDDGSQAREQVGATDRLVGAGEAGSRIPTSAEQIADRARTQIQIVRVLMRARSAARGLAPVA